jgi:hypothetical protein
MPVNWDEQGCSNDHHAALFKFWYDYHHWRFNNVSGESLFCGISIVKESYDKMMKTVGVSYCDIPRISYPFPKYAAIAVVSPVRNTTLYFSRSLAPDAPSLPSRPKLAQRLTAARSFSYSSSIASHISLPYYAEPSAGRELLPSIQHIDHALDEIHILVDVNVLDAWSKGLHSQATELYLSVSLSTAVVLSPALTHAGEVALVKAIISKAWLLQAAEPAPYPSLLPRPAPSSLPLSLTPGRSPLLFPEQG